MEGGAFDDRVVVLSISECLYTPTPASPLKNNIIHMDPKIQSLSITERTPGVQYVERMGEIVPDGHAVGAVVPGTQ